MQGKKKVIPLIGMVLLLLVIAGSLILQPNENKFIGSPQEDPETTERKNVQLAVNYFMTDNDVDTVVPQMTWTNEIRVETASGEYLSRGEYFGSTDLMKYFYQWDSEGNVYQCENTRCPDPF